MSRFDLGWRAANRLRGTPLPEPTLHERMKLRRGLRREQSLARYWLEKYAPAIAITIATILVSAVFLILFAAMDARDAQIAAELSADKATADFAHFLNGAAITDQAGTFAAKCEKLVEVWK